MIQKILHEWSFHMKFTKQAFGDFHFHEMTTNIRFCLSYDSLKLDFIAFKINIISSRKHIVDINVVNDVTFSRKSVIY